MRLHLPCHSQTHQSSQTTNPTTPRTHPTASTWSGWGPAKHTNGIRLCAHCTTNTRTLTCIGLGGAGRGGGCLAFLGGSAGLGDSGRIGGPVLVEVVRFWLMVEVGACRMAKGSASESPPATTLESLSADGAPAFPLKAEPKESSKPVVRDSPKLSSPNAAKLLLSVSPSAVLGPVSCWAGAGFGFGFCARKEHYCGQL